MNVEKRECMQRYQWSMHSAAVVAEPQRSERLSSSSVFAPVRAQEKAKPSGLKPTIGVRSTVEASTWLGKVSSASLSNTTAAHPKVFGIPSATGLHKYAGTNVPLVNAMTDGNRSRGPTW